MLRKNIKTKLAGKFMSWVKSIEDDNVRKLVQENSVITGGAIVSLLQDQEPNDYDIYFKNFETTFAVAQYYTKKWNKSHPKKLVTLQVIDEETNEKTFEQEFEETHGMFTIGSLDLPKLGSSKKRVKVFVQSLGIHKHKKEDEEKPTQEEQEEEKAKKYKPVFMSPNAITLADGIQVIIRFYGSIKEIHESFDYVHCTNSWEPDPNGAYWNKKELLRTGKLNLKTEALAAIMTKELRYIGSKYPIASVLRMRKFIARDMTINAGQVLKMVFQIQDLNLKDTKVLEDQLTGVDLFYMQQVLDIIGNKKMDDPLFNFDSTYMIKVVEEIFDKSEQEDEVE